MTPSITAPRSSRAQATLAQLWERIRRQGDMPGFSKAINTILASMRGEEEHEFSMTDTVLTDPVLTQKVLRLANSSMYSAFGQRISTVSKAILVLGTETIGHLALGLKLIEELARSAPDSEMARIEMEKAVLAGMVAQQLAADANARDPEEAVVCAILHSLGRLMITFYMPERWSDMRELAGEGRECEAAEKVLGMTVEELGRATALHWGLPRRLVTCMRSVEPGKPERPLAHDDWLAALGTLAARTADALWVDDAATPDRVAQLAISFAPMLGLAVPEMLEAFERARAHAASDLVLAPLAQDPEERAQQAGEVAERTPGNQILQRGAQDMREAGDAATAGQMIAMALETLHTGLSFQRSFAFMRNRREGRYSARLGMGRGAKPLVEKLFFDDLYEPDVFHAALSNDRVIFIENALEAKFATKLPQWWKRTLAPARCFLIIPLCAHGQPAGFIYGEWDAAAPPVSLTQGEFMLVNEVRSLAIRTIEQRNQRRAATPVRA